MKFQTFSAILLLVILGECIRVETYKWRRPYKYYRPRYRARKPRWHQSSRSARYRHYRESSPRHHYHPPSGAWKGSRSARHESNDEQPFTIQIELPKFHRGYSQFNRHHHRNSYPETTSEEYSDDEYLEEDEDFDRDEQWTRNKKLRVQVVEDVKPKFKIKISRDDDMRKIKETFMSPIGRVSLGRNPSRSYMKLNQIPGEWIPRNLISSYPKALHRRA